MVERIAERKDAAPADPPIGRLQPDDAAIGRRPADRPAGVRAHRRRAQPGADRGGRPARRAGRIVVGVPRVARRREGQGEIRPADRELVGLLLAQQHRSGILQAHPGLRVLARHMRLVDPRAGGGADALGLVDVLEADRDAVQRTARAPGRDLGICGARRRQRSVGQHQHIGMQFAVERGDARQIGLGQRERRQGAIGDRAACLGERELCGVHPLNFSGRRCVPAQPPVRAAGARSSAAAQ